MLSFWAKRSLLTKQSLHWLMLGEELVLSLSRIYLMVSILLNANLLKCRIDFYGAGLGQWWVEFFNSPLVSESFQPAFEKLSTAAVRIQIYHFLWRSGGERSMNLLPPSSGGSWRLMNTLWTCCLPVKADPLLWIKTLISSSMLYLMTCPLLLIWIEMFWPSPSLRKRCS